MQCFTRWQFLEENIKCLHGQETEQKRRGEKEAEKTGWHFIMELTLCVIYATSIKSHRMERLLAESLTL